MSRRGFAALLFGGVGCWASRSAAQEAMDRGLGGTGVAPPDPAETLGQDRGIGGTGVIGTIRRFGSIVVNDLRVTFPRDVRVVIDGRAATHRELKLGHVVRVRAHRSGRGLATREIVVRSEVVGPVDAVAHGRLVVLGQRIELEEKIAQPEMRPGDTVAVSGLRRLDGTVVASLVELRRPGVERLQGPVEAAAGDALTIGTLRIAGLARHLVGRRVSLIGQRVDETFHPTVVTVEPRLPFASADRLSLEGYVAQAPDGLRFGSGLDLPAAVRRGEIHEALQGSDDVRAVVTASAGPGGRFSVESVRVERSGRSVGRTEHRGPLGTAGRAAAPGPRGGAASRGGSGSHGGGGSGGGGHGGPGR